MATEQFPLNALKWNVIPNNIDQNPSRLWDWKNPQFWPRNHEQRLEDEQTDSVFYLRPLRTNSAASSAIIEVTVLRMNLTLGLEFNAKAELSLSGLAKHRWLAKTC